MIFNNISFQYFLLFSGVRFPYRVQNRSKCELQSVAKCRYFCSRYEKIESKFNMPPIIPRNIIVILLCHIHRVGRPALRRAARDYISTNSRSEAASFHREAETDVSRPFPLKKISAAEAPLQELWRRPFGRGLKREDGMSNKLYPPAALKAAFIYGANCVISPKMLSYVSIIL